MTKKLMSKCVPALFGLAMLCGCTTVQTVSTPAFPASEVVFAHSVLWLDDVQDRMHYKDDGTALAILTGTNNAQGARKLYVKTVWLSADGVPLRSLLSRWEKLTLQPGLPFTYKAVAPSADAAYYQINITTSLK